MEANDLEQDHTAGQPVLPLHASLRGLSMSGVAVSRLILVMALTLGVFVRLWQINLLGYNSDEAVYAGQAAAIAEAPIYKDIFPVFRAHPLLFQFMLSLVYRFGVNDLAGRIFSVAFGLVTISVAYGIGTSLYGQRAGALAALFLALMPYHVVVTRQVLLDGPMVLMATISLYLLARFAGSERPVWLYLVGLGMGLTFLTKETSIILLGSIYAFFALSPEVRVRIRDLIAGTICMGVVMSVFSIALSFSGRAKTGQQYLVWQLFRRPNHEWTFYPSTVPVAMGLLVVLAALLGFWWLRHEKSWREKLLAAWIVVPVVFFQLWPTKGFQYLLPVAPAVAVLAGRTLARWPVGSDLFVLKWNLKVSWVKWLAVGATTVSLFLSSWGLVGPASSDTFTAGTGGVPGGREAGMWIQAKLPEGAVFMTVGPSMANIIQFYGHRRAYGLSVSPNPLHRNPSYEPINNPDLQIRNGNLQYAVWDSFSAARSDFFSSSLLRFVQKHHGIVIHTETVKVTMPGGAIVEKLVIIIYQVRP